MRDEQGRAPPDQLGESLEQGLLGSGVQRGGGFVEDEGFGLPHEAAGNGHLLPLPARELCPLGELPAQHRIQSLRQPGEGLGGLPSLRGPQQARLVRHGIDLPEADVLPHRQVVVDEILQDNAQGLPQIVDIVFSQVHPIQQYSAPGRVVEPGEKLDQGGLARAVGAHHGQGLARLQLEVQVLQHQGVCAGVREAHLLQDDTRGQRPDHAASAPLRQHRQLGGHIEEVEEQGEIQQAFVRVAEGDAESPEVAVQTEEEAGVQDEVTDSDRSSAGTDRDVPVHDTGAPCRPQRRERVPSGPPQAQPLEPAVQGVKSLAIQTNEGFAQAKKPHFLGVLVPGGDLDEVLHLARLGCA